MALELNASKHRIYEYVESRMSFIAPNLSIIIGASTAAKIMGEAPGPGQRGIPGSDGPRSADGPCDLGESHLLSVRQDLAPEPKHHVPLALSWSNLLEITGWPACFFHRLRERMMALTCSAPEPQQS